MAVSPPRARGWSPFGLDNEVGRDIWGAQALRATMGSLSQGGMGRINGIRREGPVPGRRIKISRDLQLPLLALGAALYGVALAFPLLLRQVTPPVYIIALAGTAILLLGLHARWTSSPSPR